MGVGCVGWGLGLGADGARVLLACHLEGGLRAEKSSFVVPVKVFQSNSSVPKGFWPPGAIKANISQISVTLTTCSFW